MYLYILGINHFLKILPDPLVFIELLPESLLSLSLFFPFRTKMPLSRSMPKSCPLKSGNPISLITMNKKDISRPVHITTTYTLKPRYNKPGYSEFHDIVNKTQLQPPILKIY